MSEETPSRPPHNPEHAKREKALQRLTELNPAALSLWHELTDNPFLPEEEFKKKAIAWNNEQFKKPGFKEAGLHKMTETVIAERISVKRMLVVQYYEKDDALIFNFMLT